MQKKAWGMFYPIKHLKDLGNHSQSWKILWFGFTSYSTARHWRVSAMHFVLFEWISFQIYIRRQFFGKFCSVTQNTTAKIETKIEIFLIFFWIFQSKICGKNIFEQRFRNSFKQNEMHGGDTPNLISRCTVRSKIKPYDFWELSMVS